MRRLHIGQLIVRSASKKDLARYVEIQKVEWGNLAVATKQAESRFEVILKGILVADTGYKVVGSVTTMRIAGYDFNNPKSWYEVTGDGYCQNHIASGSTCFGVDLSVDTENAPSGTVDALFVGCMQLVISQGVKYFVLGGRMPSYHLHSEMPPDEYLHAKLENGHFLDPQVDMYSRVPLMKIMGLAPGYFKDPDSLNYGVILRWRNPFYRLPFAKFWADLACLVFEKYLNHQRRAYKKKLEKMPL